MVVGVLRIFFTVVKMLDFCCRNAIYFSMMNEILDSFEHNYMKFMNLIVVVV